MLSVLYHWSPADRRDAILRGGLMPYSRPTVCSGNAAYPCVSLSPTPSAAWGLSGDMEWVSDIEEWDLWQVNLAEGDEVHVRPSFGPRIEEVKVRTAIPADRVWWVARRSELAAA